MPGGYPHVGTCAEALRPGVVIACGPLSVGAFILGPRVMISSIMALLVCGRWKVRVIPTIASVIVVALVVWFAWGIYSYNIGPSGTEAFRWYLADPIPSSVSEIKIHCAPHFQGRNIFLSFTIGPIDLQEIIVQKHFRLARAIDGQFPLEAFTAIDPVAPITRENGTFYSRRDDGVVTGLAVSRDQQKAYFWYSSDPDYERR